MKVKKIISLILAAIMVTAAFAGCAGKKQQVVNLYTWADYVPKDVIAYFEKDTGNKVNYSNFETNEEMLAKLENSKGGDYDLVIASDYIIKIAGDEGLISELDKSKIPNYKNIDSKYQSFFYDSENKYTVPYAPGIPLIVYDPKKVSIDITGYESLWDPSLKDSIGIMDTERVINGITLKTLGESFNTEDLDVIQKAGDKLLKLAPNIRILRGSDAELSDQR
jgi:spermidine/putrescine transport system substrate-binding protein